VASSPAIGSDGTIYIGGPDGHVHAVSPSGVTIWTFATGGDVKSSPTIGPDGAIYVGSDDGSVYAIHSDSLGLASSAWPKFRADVYNTGSK
jgi:outer membrane protein assembly factor BamB